MQAGHQCDVLAYGQVADEPAGDLDQRSDSALHLHRPLIGEQHLRDETEQSGLALAVAPDDADRLPLLHRERDVAQRPELSGARPPRRRGEQVFEVLAPTAVAAEADAQPAGLDRDGHPNSFSTVRSRDRNVHTPSARMTRVIPTLTSSVKRFHWSGKNGIR